jgi:hypothetical protein
MVVGQGLVRSLLRLIEALDDTMGAFETAPPRAWDRDGHALHAREIEMRRRIAGRLREMVVRLGGTVPAQAPMIGKAKQWLVHLVGAMAQGEVLLPGLFEREERRLIATVNLLATADHVPQVMRSELNSVLRYLHDELCRGAANRRLPAGSASIFG